MPQVVLSAEVTGIVATPSVVTHRKSGRKKVVVGTRAIATADINEIGDKIVMALIPSNAVVLGVKIRNTDLDSNGSPTLAADVGLVYTGIGGTQVKLGKVMGDAVDADVFAAASTVLQAASTAGVDVRCATDSIADLTKEAWDAGALSADPGGLLGVALTLTAAAATAATGTITVEVEYI